MDDKFSELVIRVKDIIGNKTYGVRIPESFRMSVKSDSVFIDIDNYQFNTLFGEIYELSKKMIIDKNEIPPPPTPPNLRVGD